MTGQPDPVSTDLRAYVIRRDGGCVVGLLRMAEELPKWVGACEAEDGREVSPYLRDGLTAAHVRDRGKGGRMGKRPPSVARHLVAACYGHHLQLSGAVVDRAEVRDVLDGYLEEREGPEPVERPHEAIQRVRSARDGA